MADPTSDKYFTQAQEAYKRADYTSALALYKRALEGGEWHYAAIWIANIYYFGKGVPKDSDEAERWVTKAVDSGGTEAMYEVASHYGRGDKFPQDFKKAAMWHRKAADLGHTSAMWRLGQMYESGAGVEQSESQAVSWYEKAAQTNKKFDTGCQMAVRELARLRGDQGSNSNPSDAPAQPAASGSGCFIATAACGTAYHPDVEVLREFRDHALSVHVPGRWLMKLYDTFSPPLANWIRDRSWAKSIVRRCVVAPASRLVRTIWTNAHHGQNP